MSSELKKYDFKKFKGEISIDNNHSLQYLRKQTVNADEIVFTLHITNKALKSWYDIRETLSCSFVEILNCFLAENYAILIKKDNKRIDDHLRRLASYAKSNSKGKSGSASVNFDRASKRIAIRHGELQTAYEIECELSRLKFDKQVLEEEQKVLHERCNELYENLVQAEKLRTACEEKLTEAYADIEKLRRENASLWVYFDKISEQEGYKNTGKNIAEVKERQQRRKIRELKTYVDKALWFASTFGLQLSSVEFNDDTGKTHTIEYQVEEGKKSYNELSDKEKEKVQQVLYITDRFCISEAAYHELTMTVNGEDLPRSYLVKQCKTDLNRLCHISRTPGEYDGAQLDFESELENTIKKQVSVIVRYWLHICQASGNNEQQVNETQLCNILLSPCMVTNGLKTW